MSISKNEIYWAEAVDAKLHLWEFCRVPLAALLPRSRALAVDAVGGVGAERPLSRPFSHHVEHRHCSANDRNFAVMSDMELSAIGEEGDLSEEYNEGEQTFEEEDEDEEEDDEDRPRADGNAPLGCRQGENHEKGVVGGRRDQEHRRMVDITRDKPVKVTVRVVVPVRDHPKFNFVGKLLGPKGNSLKRLQEDTMTKMAILGRGSMKDKHKEEELRLSGDPKFSHLHDDLHVEITAFAPPAEAHARIAYALADVRRFLVPDYNDDIRQEQMWEMQILKERPDESSVLGDVPGLVLPGSVAPVAAEPPGPTDGNRGQSPHTSPSAAADCPLASSAQHPALRGVALHSSLPAVPTVGTPNGRKRPLFSSSARHSFSPTKRTVMSILARARASQAKQIPGYHLNGSGGNIVGIRQVGAVVGANLV